MSPAKPPRQPHELDAIRARVADIRQRRGYVLPSHAALAVADPVLLEQYESVYNAITFGFHALTPFEKKGLMATDVTTLYRDKVLAVGGQKDAVDIVKDFLGRPYNFKAFEKYLSEP
jgi:thimet oligopeptidase